MGAGHGHAHVEGAHPPSPPQVRRVVMAVILPLVAATIIGLIVLWPSGVDAVGGEQPDRRKGEVIAVTGPCPKGAPPPADGSCGATTVDLGDGEPVVAQIPSGPGAPQLSPGDK